MTRSMPEIEDWTILRDGRLRGKVRDHPYMDDGDLITTSPVFDTEACSEYSVVQTQSGSRYLITEAHDSMMNVVDEGYKETEKEKEVELAHPLSGRSVGNGQYLLVGRASRSTSGKSEIWNAYKANEYGEPIVQNIGKGTTAIKVKLSDNTQALIRENSNYDKVSKGFGKDFVEKLDFFPIALGKGMEDLSALVMESGIHDLRKHISENASQGFRGKEMLEIALSAGKCLQSIHASNLVWTDLKTENFVLTGKGVRGIDLESAVAVGRHPIDYSPEACPPEFADALMNDRATEFIVDPSYDMWSLGMMLYELSTGASYFEGMEVNEITDLLRNPYFEVDASLVEEDSLQDLIQWCLSTHPELRPTISEYLRHSYFKPTTFDPLNFFGLKP